MELARLSTFGSHYSSPGGHWRGAPPYSQSLCVSHSHTFRIPNAFSSSRFTCVFSLSLTLCLTDFTPPPACSHSSVLSPLPVPIPYCTHTHTHFFLAHTQTSSFHSLFYSSLLFTLVSLTHSLFSHTWLLRLSLSLLSEQFGIQWPLYGDFFL